MIPLLRSELFRLTRRAMPRVLLLILVAALAAFYLLLWTVVRNSAEEPSGLDVSGIRDGLRVGAARATGLSLVQQAGTVLVVIVAASTVATEFTWGTIRTLLPRSDGRSALLTAKLIALLLFVAVTVLVGYLAALGASALVTALEGLDRDLGPQFLSRTLASLARTAYVMLPFLALAFLVAVWARSSAAGIGIGLAVLFLEGLLTSLMTAAGGPLERVADAMPGRNVEALLNANAEGVTSAANQAATNDLPGGCASRFCRCDARRVGLNSARAHEPGSRAKL